MSKYYSILLKLSNQKRGGGGGGVYHTIQFYASILRRFVAILHYTNIIDRNFLFCNCCL
jgi:hypothetical protein